MHSVPRKTEVTVAHGFLPTHGGRMAATVRKPDDSGARSPGPWRLNKTRGAPSKSWRQSGRRISRRSEAVLVGGAIGACGRTGSSGLRVDLEEVYRFAATAHAGELRKGSGQPYIAHPEAVVEILRGIGVDDPAILAAALLHDVVENSPVTLADIAARFGEDVAGLVAELTRPPETHEKRDAFRRYLDRLSPRALLIKLADRIENLRGLRLIHDDPAFVAAYLDETRELFLPLAERTPAQLAALLREVYESASGDARGQRS